MFIVTEYAALKWDPVFFQTVLLMCGILYQTQLWRHLHWMLSNQGWTNIGTDMSSNSMHRATSRVKQCFQILWEDVQMGL